MIFTASAYRFLKFLANGGGGVMESVGATAIAMAIGN